MAETLTQEAADAAFDATTVPEAPDPAEDADKATSPAPDAPDAPDDVAPDAPAAAPKATPAPDTPAAEQPDAPQADEPMDLSSFAPFSYRADGGEHAFPGAVVDDDGQVLFSRDAVPTLRQALAHAAAYPRVQREMGREVQSLTQAREAAELERNTVLERLDQLFGDPRAAAEFLQAGAENWRVLRAEAKAKAIEYERQRDREELERFQTERTEAEQRPVLEGLIEEALDHWLQGDYAVDAATRSKLAQRYRSQLDRVFPKATDDDPARGLRKGQRMDARATVMKEELELFFSGRPKGTNGQVVARNADGTFAKAEAAKQENAKRTAPVKATPAVAAGKAAAPAGRKGPVPGKTPTVDADAMIW